MTRPIDAYQMEVILNEFDRDDVDLFGLNGQRLFPLMSSSGGVRAAMAAFPILRGIGDRAPAFEGSFPTKEGEIVDFGRGWRVTAVLITLGQSHDEIRASFRKALELLRGEHERV